MLTTRNDTASFLHGRCARCCLLPSLSKCWLVHCAGADDVLSDSHLQSSTLAMLRAQLQVLVAVIILLAQHWHRRCTGPCPRTTQNSLVIHTGTSKYTTHILLSLTEILNNTPEGGESSGQADLLNFTVTMCRQHIITHLIFFWTNDALNFMSLYYTILFGLFLLIKILKQSRIRFSGNKKSEGFP